MLPRLILAGLLAASAASVQAVDTFDSAPPAASAPAAADRLGAARKAIAAGDFEAAQRELQAAVRDDPRNADAHNLLGYTWRKRPQPDVKRAFEHYYAALKINPKHRGAHEYIGQAYLMDRRPADAEKHLAELRSICGTTCPEYQELSRAIADYRTRQ